MAAADALSVQVMHKVAQLGSRCVGNCPGRVAEGGDGEAESPQVAPPDDVFAGTRERSAGRGRCGSRSPPSGRSGGRVRQLARCAQIRLEPGASAHVRSHAYRSAYMPRTAFTGRDLTRIVGRVEVEGLVGTSPEELGAGLPYG